MDNKTVTFSGGGEISSTILVEEAVFDNSMRRKATTRMERRSLSGINTPILRSPRANTPLSNRRTRTPRRSFDSIVSPVVVGLNTLKPTVHMDTNTSSTKLTSTNMVVPDISIVDASNCTSNCTSTKTVGTSSISHDSSRESYSLSAEEAIAGLGLDRDGLKHLKMNFNLIDEDGIIFFHACIYSTIYP